MGEKFFRTEDWISVATKAEFRPAKMAGLCGISNRQLQRVFKKQLQCTPSRWLRDLQCKLAKALIAQGYSSKAAAIEVNFSTNAHFCREFKKAFGKPPQTFAPAKRVGINVSPIEKETTITPAEFSP